MTASPSLISLFDSICLSDGDNTAFITTSSSSQDDAEVGYTELREAIITISGELYHRHGLRKSQQSVLIVSTYPSVGESASVLACIRLRIPFVSIHLIGPNRVGYKLKECN